MQPTAHNGPVTALINAVQVNGLLIIDETVLQQMQAAADVADTIAAEEAYEASLDDKDRAYIAYVDTFIRRQQRRNSKRQWGC